MQYFNPWEGQQSTLLRLLQYDDAGHCDLPASTSLARYVACRPSEGICNHVSSRNAEPLLTVASSRKGFLAYCILSLKKGLYDILFCGVSVFAKVHPVGGYCTLSFEIGCLLRRRLEQEGI
jgi:hypothetical protein